MSRNSQKASRRRDRRIEEIQAKMPPQPFTVRTPGAEPRSCFKGEAEIFDTGPTAYEGYREKRDEWSREAKKIQKEKKARKRGKKEKEKP
jgi:hypothetical protein